MLIKIKRLPQNEKAPTFFLSNQSKESQKTIIYALRVFTSFRVAVILIILFYFETAPTSIAMQTELYHAQSLTL